MFKYSITIILIILLILLIIYFLPLKKKTVYINKKLVQVEIADNSLARYKGLSFRKELCGNCGMLFVYDSSRERIFTMRNMKFPLDFIWINDNKIIQINKEINPAQKNKETPMIKGPKSNYVLEVNAGFCDKNNIKTGDKIILN